MKATKYIFKVECEALSMDCMAALLMQVVNALQEEAHKGQIGMEDGDQVTWTTDSKAVEF